MEVIMENKYKDLIYKDGKWYVSYETLMKKSPSFRFKVLKAQALHLKGTIMGTPAHLPGGLYEVKNPDEFIKTLKD